MSERNGRKPTSKPSASTTPSKRSDARSSNAKPSSAKQSDAKHQAASKKTQRTFTVIQWIFILLTFSLIGWMIKIVVMDKEEIETNDYNPVTEEAKINIIRGSILDVNGEIVAYTDINEDGSESRRYPYGESLAHVVGYTGRGESGLEAELSEQLLTSSLLDQMTSWANEEKVRGNAVKLTIDAALQEFIYERMEGYRGAVIITDPSTGAVKVLVSSPSYDPETLIDNWELIADRNDSPLYPRATQGLYAPGSTFKIITALAMYRNMSDYLTYSYSCDGTLEAGESTIACAGGEVHGIVTIPDAFAESCNGFFGSAGIRMGKDALEAAANYVKIGSDFGFILPVSTSSLGLDTYESDGMIAQTSIGQGKVTLTPFFLNMLTCSIANGGVLYSPYLVDSYYSSSGTLLAENEPKLFGTIMGSSEAAFLQSLMKGVVEYGTGTELQSDRYTVYGKTGTAQVEGDSDHSWFTGYVVRDGKVELAFTVLIENGGREKRAIPLVRDFLDYLYAE